MRHTCLAVLTAILLATWPAQAHAAPIVFGVDIESGGYTQVGGAFGGDDTGYVLSNSCLLGTLCSQSSYIFQIDTSALLDPLTSALLDFDTSGLTTGGLLPEVFTVSVFDGVFKEIGTLGSGPLSLNLSSFGDEIGDGTLTVKVESSTLYSESVRLDGANLSVTAVPEPATFSLLAIGALAGLAGARKRVN